MLGSCTPVERCVLSHSAILQHGRASQLVTLHPRHMHPSVGVLQYLMTSIGRHLNKEGGLQVTPRHTLVWGTEVDLGRAWGDPACSMPATASHPKAPALFMPGIAGGQMEAWQTSMRCDTVCNEPVGMFLGPGEQACYIPSII